MKNPRSLKKNDMFLKVYKKGSRVHHKYFVLHFYPNGCDFNRLGIKVGKKIAGAVGRNRIKRLVREAFRRNIGEVRGYDFVIVAKEGAHQLSGFFEVSNALTLLFGRAQLGQSKHQ